MPSLSSLFQSKHSLPPEYKLEISTLVNALVANRPQNTVEFCYNHFHKRYVQQVQSQKRLKAEQAEPGESPVSPLHGPSTMAQTSFPGSNPFGGAAHNPTMHQLREEDDMDTIASPTNPNFQNPGFGRGPSSAASPFGGSSFDPSASSFHGGAGEGLPNNYALGRRTSVSAESMNPTASDSDDWKPPSHPKSAEQVDRIRTAVKSNFLFSHLAEEQLQTVLAALFEKPIPAKGIKVISQGDVGDNFYIVERGTFDVHIHPSGSIQAGPEGLGNKVSSIGPGGSFGELALMYNANRAATVISTEGNSLLWALDRMTFRRILMDAAFQKRRMFESFLEEVPLLSTLAPYERAKIADALETQRFQPGSTIIREGDKGESFYILESGNAAVYKNESGNSVLRTYVKGDYFGELALLDDKPRAATVVAVDEVRVATLDAEGFKRLLGPVEGRMREADPSRPHPGGHQHNTSIAMSEGVDPLHS